MGIHPLYYKWRSLYTESTSTFPTTRHLYLSLQLRLVDGVLITFRHWLQMLFQPNLSSVFKLRLKICSRTTHLHTTFARQSRCCVKGSWVWTSATNRLFSKLSDHRVGSLKGYSIIGSWSGFTMNSNPKWIRLTLDTPKSFDLPSQSEPKFTVNPDPDPIIELPLKNYSVFWRKRVMPLCI